jgi:hypothetical protein
MQRNSLIRILLSESIANWAEVCNHSEDTSRKTASCKSELFENFGRGTTLVRVSVFLKIHVVQFETDTCKNTERFTLRSYKYYIQLHQSFQEFQKANIPAGIFLGPN